MTANNVYYNDEFMYTPDTNTLAVNINGNATRATKTEQDADGNVISDTYMKLEEFEETLDSIGYPHS